MPDFIPPGLNPLEIPEIIAMVGQLIPICKSLTRPNATNPLGPPTNVSVFAPADLLSCASVSRKWRRLMLPTLWRSYDGALMKNVPTSVIHQNSLYFRSFWDYYGRHHPGPMQSTNLRHLTISQQHDWTLPFLATNSNLQHLTWTGFGQTLTDTEYTVLLGLVNLKDLCLSNWNILGRQLANILATSHNLERLSLSFISGVLDLEGMMIMEELVELSLGYVPPNSQALFQLLQYSPNLQRISFRGTWIEDQPRDIMALSASLRIFCPELRSIQFTASYCFGTGTYSTLKDSEYAALAQSSGRGLSQFSADIAGLGYLMTDSLISQFGTLMAIDLCDRRRHQQHPHDGGGGYDGGGALGIDATVGTMDVSSMTSLDQTMDIVNKARILSTCSRLRLFRFSNAFQIV